MPAITKNKKTERSLTGLCKNSQQHKLNMQSLNLERGDGP